MFWIVAGLLAVGTIALVLRTLTAPAVAPDDTDGVDEEIAICRAQLAELERDVQSGLVSAEDAADSRALIQRRLLDADSRRHAAAPASSATASARVRTAVIFAVALTPVAAAGLYLHLGHPGRVGTPPQVRQTSAGSDTAPEAGRATGEKMPSLEVLAGRLEERLETTPEDPRGWGLLGRTYSVMGQYPKAAEAYRKAVALEPGVAELQSGLGEAITLSSEGQVTPEALEAFRRAKAMDPSDSAARFYLGMADYQQGKFGEALDAWVALARDAPPNAPWLPELRSQITALANQLGVDPKSVLPNAKSPTAKSAEKGEDATALMARLQESPKDYEGWIRLARLRSAAGDEPGARAALQAGREAFPDAPFVQQMLARTATELGLEDGGNPSGGQRGPTSEDIQSAAQMSDEDRQAMITGMVSGLAARLEENPDDPDGWRMLARSYRVLGEMEKSAEAYRRLTEIRPDDASAQAVYALSLVALDVSNSARFGDKTVKALRHAVQLDGDNAQTLFYLGKAAEQRGDRKQAETHWKRVVRNLPKSAPLRKEAEALLEGAEQ